MATAAAQYSTGFFSTPGDLLTQANQLNGQVQALDTAIDGNNAIPQNWWDSWTSFQSGWLAFFSGSFGGQGFTIGPSGSSWSATGSWLTSDLAGQLGTYEAQFATFATQAQQWGVQLPGGIIQPPSNSPDLSGIDTTLVIVIVLLIVFGIVK